MFGNAGRRSPISQVSRNGFCIGITAVTYSQKGVQHYQVYVNLEDGEASGSGGRSGWESIVLGCREFLCELVLMKLLEISIFISDFIL